MSDVAAQQEEVAMSNGIRTRANVAGMTSEHPTLAAYRTAVREMKNLPESDPRNWRRQARIHFDGCPHGNWFFLPWHRQYVLEFEQICRDLSGDPDFALPYWNWTANRSIPAPFWGAPCWTRPGQSAGTPRSQASSSGGGSSTVF